MDAILEPQDFRKLGALRKLRAELAPEAAACIEIQWKRYGAHNDVGQGSRHFGLPGTFPPDSVSEHFGI